MYRVIYAGMDPWVLAVMSQKGGVGKTTSAIHIAGHLAALGKRTLLIDGDREGFALAWLRVEGGQENPDVPFDALGIDAGIEAMPGYEAVVIDMQGGQPVDEVQAVGELASVLLLPCVPEFQAVRGMTATTQLLAEAGVPLERVRVLLTMDVRQGTAAEDARTALEAGGLTVLKRTVRNTVAVRHAALAGTLVHRVPGVAGKMASEDYRAVTRELLEVGA